MTTTHGSRFDAKSDEMVVRDVLDRWKDAVDAHDPQGVAALFTVDAIFQGLHPYGVGRETVATYYGAQPRGLTADYHILETRRLADDLVLAYLSVEFSFTDRPPLQVYLSVLVKRASEGDLLCHYQVSWLE